jgi:hypothetical protein
MSQQNIAAMVVAEARPEVEGAADAARQALLRTHEKLHNLALPRPCEVCNESLPHMTFQVRKHICQRCATSKKKKQFGRENNLLPDLIPPVLQGLTMAEESLICIISPIIKVFQATCVTEPLRVFTNALPV